MTSHKLDTIKKHIKHKSSKIYRKLLHKSSIHVPDVKSNNLSLNTGFFTILFTLIWNGIIIYYLHSLEDSSCKCIRDWRHNFMKTIAYINIILSLIPFLAINLKFNKYLLMVLGISIIILNSIYIYAYYTYIGILNATNCECAIVKESEINYLLNYKRGTIAIFYILGIITILTGINISFSLNISNKKFHYHV